MLLAASDPNRPTLPPHHLPTLPPTAHHDVNLNPRSGACLIQARVYKTPATKISFCFVSMRPIWLLVNSLCRGRFLCLFSRYITRARDLAGCVEHAEICQETSTPNEVLVCVLVFCPTSSEGRVWIRDPSIDTGGNVHPGSLSWVECP